MKIVTITTGNTIFLDIQQHTFKKYMKNDYEFIVINACVSIKDFSNNYQENVIDNAIIFCKKNNIEFINFINNENEQNEYNNMDMPSNRHSYILKKLLNYMKDNLDEYLLIDSDMFLVDDFNVDEYNKNYDIAMVLQSRYNIKYIWPNLLYLNMKKLINLELLTSFDNGSFKNVGLDTGGGSHTWLYSLDINLPDNNKIRYGEYDEYNNSENRIKYIKHLWSCSWISDEYPSNLPLNILHFCENDPRNVNSDKCVKKNFCEIYDKKFLHIRGGSGWLKEGNNIHKKINCDLHNILVSSEYKNIEDKTASILSL